MAVQIKKILDRLDCVAPFQLAEAWDNVGLLVGDPDQPVTGILIGLDPAIGLIEEAIRLGANLIITHHPVIFKPLAKINTGESEGRLLAKALTSSIAIACCHTNLDNTTPGVSDILAERLGLASIRPLLPSLRNPAHGLGRMGEYDSPIEADAFLQKINTALRLSAVQMAGILPEKISKVAVCGGSGSEFAPLARQQGADVYLTAEIKHNIAVWAAENRFCVIDGTHYATEHPAVALLARQLRLAAELETWRFTIAESEMEHHPLTFTSLRLTQEDQHTQESQP